MAYAAMMIVDQRVIGTVGAAATHPTAFVTMLARAPKTDGIAHLLEFDIDDVDGKVVSAKMDKEPVPLG